MKKFSLLLGLLLLWMQPVRADVLVLVHGYMADARTWDASGINQVLASHGWQPAGVLSAGPNGVFRPASFSVTANKSYSVNLPAAAPLPAQAAALNHQLNAVRQWHPEERLILVGHSAGGVVARMLLLGDNPYSVDTLVTIAAPNLGTVRAAQGLDVVDFNPFFCPGPGIEFLKSVFGGDEYDYLEHSRGALIDLLPAESGNILAWLNQQPHPDIHYYAVVRGSPHAAGDRIVPAYSQDMNNVPALRGRVKVLYTPAGHGLNPQDGLLLAGVLTQQPANAASPRP
jgi:pimeloyl-ACP methyl ester carboxylesterase